MSEIDGLLATARANAQNRDRRDMLAVQAREAQLNSEANARQYDRNMAIDRMKREGRSTGEPVSEVKPRVVKIGKEHAVPPPGRESEADRQARLQREAARYFGRSREMSN